MGARENAKDGWPGANLGVNRWIAARNRVEGTRIRLFCLPHAGSGSAIFHPWKRSLPAWVEVCPIQLPGREVRLAERPYTNGDVLIEEMAEALTGHLDRPYAIFGHSMGALLAFELAQRLRSKALRAPSYLFLSGRIAAHLPWGHKRIHHLPAEEFLEELGARYGGLPQELLCNPFLLEVYLPILRADMTLIETHQHRERPPLGCPIMAFAGTDDGNVSDESLAAWSQQTTADFSVRRLAGDHFYLSGSSRELLLELLCEKLIAMDATHTCWSQKADEEG